MSYQQNIKVSEALKKGYRWINIPAILLLCLFIFICLPVLLYVFRNDKNNSIVAVLGVSTIVLGLITPFLWYALNIVKYKIWAGKYVKDIYRFHEEALSKKLINEHKFFKKIEIKSLSQKKELNKFYYKRLNEDRKLVADFNQQINSDTYFKPSLTNVIIFIILISSIFIANQIYAFNERLLFGSGGIALVFISIDLYAYFRYKYTLKINREYISYKDDKHIIYWKDIIDYNLIQEVGRSQSKLIVNTHGKTKILILNNFFKQKANKVIRVLNENKHRYDVKSSTK